MGNIQSPCCNVYNINIARILVQLLEHLLCTCGQDGGVVVGVPLLMFEDLQLQEELLLMEMAARGLV